MNFTRTCTRSLAVVAFMALAACQTAPVQQAAAPAPEPAGTPAPTSPPVAPDAQPAAEQGAPVAVLLADTVAHDGWRPIPVGSDSTIYIDPVPLVTRDDLTGVQAGSNQQGQGLLALVISDDARMRLQDITSRNPNRRLALVVGSTLMAAPTYSEPVSSSQLIFPVGTEENATAAARAIAGIDDSGASSAPGGSMGVPGSR